MTTLALLGLGGWEILLILFVFGGMAVAFALLIAFLVVFVARRTKDGSQHQGDSKAGPQPPSRS